MQARLHAEAELSLCDPRHPLRKRLISQCREHPSWQENYVSQLKGLSPLEDHEFCRKRGNDGALPPGTHLALAFDCEMIETTGNDMALARVSVVDVEGRQVLDVFVLPCEPTYIVDCRTRITGLCKDDLVEKGVTVREAQRRFAELCCAETVLMGHALDHDLLALGFRHDLVIDTSFLYPVLDITLTGPTFDRLHSLSYLSETVLGRSMDRSDRGGVHDSIEDSVNSLDLVKYLVCTLARSDMDRAPAIPFKGRRFRQRGPNFGFAEALRARQVFASNSMAGISWAKDEARKARVREFYSFHLISSTENYGHEKLTILSSRTPEIPKRSRPTDAEAESGTSKLAKVASSNSASSATSVSSVVRSSRGAVTNPFAVSSRGASSSKADASLQPPSTSNSQAQNSSQAQVLSSSLPSSSAAGPAARVFQRVQGDNKARVAVEVAQTDLHRVLANDRERIRLKNQANSRMARLMGKSKKQSRSLFGR